MAFAKGQHPFTKLRAERAAIRNQARAEAGKCLDALVAIRDDVSAAPEVRATAAVEILHLAKMEGRVRPVAREAA